MIFDGWTMAESEVRLKKGDKSILWLDREPMGCTPTKRKLERLGYDVDLVSNIGEAVDFSSRAGYSLLVVEPYPDYLRTCSEEAITLRDLMERMNSRGNVMVFSSQEENWLGDEGIQRGTHYDDARTKPISPEHLSRLISSYFERS